MKLSNFLRTLYIKNRNLLLYGVIGGLSAGTDYFVYIILIEMFNFYYLTANLLSVTVGISISFILNSNVNFKVKDKLFKRFSIFTIIGVSGMILSTLLLFLFIDIIKFDSLVAKGLSIIIVVLIQYLLNKRITFRQKF